MRVCRALAIPVQKSVVHLGSLSVIMLSGNPNLQTMYLTNKCAKPSVSNPVVVGMNDVCFDRQSTTTKIALYPSNQGKLTRKSIDMDW